MRWILALFRAVLFLIGLVFATVILGTVMVVGGLFMLLSGRKPQFRVVTRGDLRDVILPLNNR